MPSAKQKRGLKEINYTESKHDPEFFEDIDEDYEKAKKRKKRNGIIIAVILIIMLMIYFLFRF